MTMWLFREPIGSLGASPSSVHPLGAQEQLRQWGKGYLFLMSLSVASCLYSALKHLTSLQVILGGDIFPQKDLRDGFNRCTYQFIPNLSILLSCII